jgi:hypothetical protein
VRSGRKVADCFRKEDSMKSISAWRLHTGRILSGILMSLMGVAAVGADIATAADEIRIGFTPPSPVSMRVSGPPKSKPSSSASSRSTRLGE